MVLILKDSWNGSVLNTALFGARMKLFAEIVNGFEPLTIFTKGFIIDV